MVVTVSVSIAAARVVILAVIKVVLVEVVVEEEVIEAIVVTVADITVVVGSGSNSSRRHCRSKSIGKHNLV